MGRLLQYLAALVLSAFSLSASAAVQWTGHCYGGGLTAVKTNYSDAFAACVGVGYNTATYSMTQGTPTPTSTGYTATYKLIVITNGATYSSGNLTATLACTSPNTFIAGTPPSCSSVCPPGTVTKPDGTCGAPCVVGDALIVAGKSNGDSGFPDATVCDNFCTYALVVGPADLTGSVRTVLGTLVGGTGKYDHSWSAKYKGNAAACSMSTNPDAPKRDLHPDFLQNPDTKNTAQWHPGDQCGYVNGNYHCSAPIPNGTCVSTSNGDGVCMVAEGASLSSPPAPDNGTAGQLARPVATVTQNSATTNIYNSSTMTSSTVGVGKGTDGSTTGTTTGSTTGTTTGSTTGSTVGTAANPSVEDCHTSGTCTDGTGALTATTPSDVKDFGQATSDFYSALQLIPISLAFTQIANAVPSGGSAPSSSFSLWGHTYTLAIPPEVIASVTPVLTTVMKAFWCLLAILVFMAA